MHEQEIQAELAHMVARRERFSIISNLIGLVLLGFALAQLVNPVIVTVLIGLRLTAMAFTHYNSVRTRRVMEAKESLEPCLRWFSTGLFFAALSWAALLVPLRAEDFTTLPGLLIATVTALGVCMIALMSSPVPHACRVYLATFTVCLVAYVTWRLDSYGPAVLIGAIVVMAAVYSFAHGLGRESYKMAQATVQNRWLTENLKIALAEAERLSRTDPLTGLFNRRYFHDHASDYLKDEAATASVMLIDLDHFKRINDHAGHAVGDSVLQAVGNLLQAICARDHLRDAVAARIGGEEFAIFIPDQTGAEIEKQTDNLRRTISGLAAFNWSGKIDLSASIGLAYRRRGETLGEMLHRADMALYGAKKNGRDQIKLAAA